MLFITDRCFKFASQRDLGWCPTSAVVDELPMEESAVRKRLKRAAKSDTLPIEK